MSKRNESSPGNQLFLQIEFGFDKKILVQKYQFSYDFSRPRELPLSPLFVFPEVRYHMDANPAVRILREFYESNLVLPLVTINSEFRVAQSSDVATWYELYDVTVIELFGHNGDRFSGFYKLHFNSLRVNR